MTTLLSPLKRILLLALLSISVNANAENKGSKVTPSVDNAPSKLRQYPLSEDDTDDTDVYAIPLDSSVIEEDQEEEYLQEIQSNYQKKH